MHKFIKCLFCYLCTVMVLFSLCFFAVPGFATGMPDGVTVLSSTSGVFTDLDGNSTNVSNGWSNAYVFSSLGEYVVNFGDGTFPFSDDGIVYSAVSLTYLSDGIPITLYYNLTSPFTFTIDDSFDFISESEFSGYALVLVNSYNEPPFISEPEFPPLYSSAWDLLKYHIYGDMELTPEMNLTLTLFATLIAVAVVVLPFVIIWLIIRFVSSLLR